MNYRDRAVEALRESEQKLRADLQALLTEAVVAEAYADIATIARIANALSDLRQQLLSEIGDGEQELTQPATNSPGGDRRSLAEEQRLRFRDPRREHYPQFLRDGDRLVKVAWSKKERGPYEHRAPRAVIQALVQAIQKNSGEGKLFQAAGVMPLKNAMREKFPSYQSYLALSWLREVGVISKRGREGYMLKRRAASAEKLARLWAELPVFESNE